MATRYIYEVKNEIRFFSTPEGFEECESADSESADSRPGRKLGHDNKKYPLLQFFPERIINFFLKIVSPIVVAKIKGEASQKTGVPTVLLVVS